MTDNTVHYYNHLLEIKQQALVRIRKKIYSIGTLRLCWVILTLTVLYFLWGYNTGIIIGTIIAGIACFLGMMRIHDRFFARKSFLEAKISICKKELQLKRYDFEGIDTGKEYIDPTHDFSNDLDIFGKKSLFAYLNRSASLIGQQKLVEWITHPLTDPDKIRNRQQAVEELSLLTELRIDFLANGMTSRESKTDAQIISELSNDSPIYVSKWLHIILSFIPWIFGILILMWIFGVGTGNYILFLFLTCFCYATILSGRVSRTQNKLNEGLKSLNTYAGLIEQLEKSEFSSSLLQNIRTDLHTEGIPVSSRIKQLGKYLRNLDQRYNAIGFAILNGFFLWDFKQLAAIEKWIRNNGKFLPGWIETIARFDALCSLATFRFNHPEYIFPVLNDNDNPVMKATELGHPLIEPERCVCNPVEMLQRPSFLVITGANMAGKSTYLRTIGINHLLACIGAPVCAKEMQLSPCKLFTSLRTTDSLSDQESYFFAELKRLKQIIDRLESGEKLFIILDEILKGTNSTDKQKGSLALVQKLVKLNAAGVIATHDLLLGSLAEKWPDTIENFRFEADINDNELSFSYKLQPGVAQNMNACFLMEKMGIIPKE